jgi:hypothetical protein
MGQPILSLAKECKAKVTSWHRRRTTMANTRWPCSYSGSKEVIINLYYLLTCVIFLLVRVREQFCLHGFLVGVQEDIIGVYIGWSLDRCVVLSLRATLLNAIHIGGFEIFFIFATTSCSFHTYKELLCFYYIIKVRS